MRQRGVPILIAVLAAPLAGQAPVAARDSGVAALVAAVRAATIRYQDQSVAIADGYRQVGPDFPGMGEHWISVPLVTSGAVDPLRPPLLEYATIGQRPTLVGVAWTRLEPAAAGPLPGFPVPDAAWHYHAGTVDEESFILGHAEGPARAEPPGPRIAVLHAWVWLENPAGLFATDNWALPWARLGLKPSADAPLPGAATFAIALAAGGERYFATLIRLRFRPDSTAMLRVDRLLTARALRIRVLLEEESETRQRDRRLAGEWGGLCADLAAIHLTPPESGMSVHPGHGDGLHAERPDSAEVRSPATPPLPGCPAG